MSKLYESEKVVSAAVVAVGIIIASLLIGWFWYIATLPSGHSDTVVVNGIATQTVTSDSIKWPFSFSREVIPSSPKFAYDQMEKDEKVIVDFLHKNNIADSDITITPVGYFQSGDYAYGQSFTTPTLRQNVDVRSKNVVEVTKLSAEIEPLLQAGVKLSSQPLEYSLTNLPQLQADVIAKAVDNARETASHLTLPGNRHIKNLSTLNIQTIGMGPVNSTQDYANDTTTMQKDIRATVNATFYLTR